MRWWDASAVAAAELVLFGADAWSEEAVWGELAAPGRWYVVAVGPTGEAAGETADERTAGDDVLGYAGLAGPGGPGGDADVATVAVLPGAQGRGVGRALLRALLAEAVRRGAGAVLLEVRVGNAPARALYASEGFERLAVRRRYYADGSDAEVMRWRPRAPARMGA